MSKSSNNQWYSKLNSYFPEHEMKNKQQLEDLLKFKEGYHKLESEDYVMLYAEFPEFLFIDYLLVTASSRGKGIGSKVLEKLKSKKKLIVLEAEPCDADDKDTERRLDFYMKNGFKPADKINYTREDKQGEMFELDILYWTPFVLEQDIILKRMQQALQEIHNFRSNKYYGKKLADPEDSLELRS